MGFKALRFYQFRNIIDTEISLTDKDVYLVGENGQGKTNFLEAIYLICYGSSFRTRNERNLIKHGHRDLSLSASFKDDKQQIKILFKLEKGRKTIEIDGKKIRDRKELLSNFPCIAFTHDDINYVNGPPSERRTFLNQTISLYDPSYIDNLRIYNRLIKLRNRIIKEKNFSLLDIYDDQIAAAGFELVQKRRKLVDEFNSTFTDLYNNISLANMDLIIRYSPSWKNVNSVDDVLALLKSQRERDIHFSTSTSGPHRDRVGFFSDGRNFAETASTGQIRLISLVLKASQSAFIYKKSGKLPVLLLDDVLLEMDLEKRKRFLHYLPDYRQAFYTFLPDEGLIEFKNGGPIFTVKQGIITREESFCEKSS